MSLESLSELPSTESAAARSGLPGGALDVSLFRANGATARRQARRIEPGDHVVQFYDSDQFLVDSIAEQAASAIASGGAYVLIATQAHRAGVESELKRRSIDLAGAMCDHRYAGLDAAGTLEHFMSDGLPDATRFNAIIKPVFASATGDGRSVAFFGEMVGLLVAEGNHAATLTLESFWNDLQRELGFSLLCAYPTPRDAGENAADLTKSICARHSHVIPAESYTNLETLDERNRAIVMLQQKERWLEAEIAHQQRTEHLLQCALASERAAREETEAALRVRDEFLAIAAHELRTPLAGLSVQAEMSLRQLKRDGMLQPERLETALQVIAAQAIKLRNLIDRLLDVSRLETGKLSLERECLELVGFVRQAVAGAQAHSVRHIITFAAAERISVYADRFRLEQVLANLLDNAIKYSPAGGAIDVTVRRASGPMAEISVRDFGIGIPTGVRDRIFERFYQAHAQTSRSGLGLGLYVSRQTVELHGGTIDAEFPDDGGTRMVVRLPMAPADDAFDPNAAACGD